MWLLESCTNLMLELAENAVPAQSVQYLLDLTYAAAAAVGLAAAQNGAVAVILHQLPLWLLECHSLHGLSLSQTAVHQCRRWSA